MTKILFGTPNSKTKGSLGLLLKISTENPVIHLTLQKPEISTRSNEPLGSEKDLAEAEKTQMVWIWKRAEGMCWVKLGR